MTPKDIDCATFAELLFGEDEVPESALASFIRHAETCGHHGEMLERAHDVLAPILVDPEISEMIKDVLSKQAESGAAEAGARPLRLLASSRGALDRFQAWTNDRFSLLSVNLQMGSSSDSLGTIASGGKEIAWLFPSDDGVEVHFLESTSEEERVLIKRAVRWWQESS